MQIAIMKIGEFYYKAASILCCTVVLANQVICGSFVKMLSVLFVISNQYLRVIFPLCQPNERFRRMFIGMLV